MAGQTQIVVAVNAQTGALAAFDRDCGVDLVDTAIAATALPGECTGTCVTLWT